MKILFITDLIPIEENENCAKALVPIIQELALNNIVDIIRPNFIFNSYLRGKAIKQNGTYNCNNLEIKNINFLTPFLFPPKDIDLSVYDQIIAHMPSGILFAERLLKSAKQRPQVIYAVHQSDVQVMTSLKYALYFRTALKKSYKNCDRIICRSPHLKDKLLKILPDCAPKTSIKSSRIPKKYFISEQEMFDKIKVHDGIKFITAANLIKRKNIDLLIKAFEPYKNNNFTLEVIGDGKELNKLKKLSKSLNLDNKITFSRKLPHEEVLKKMRDSNVFILPSVNETLGLVYLEASASGCLCVGTKRTGIDGILHDNINCFLCEPTVKGVSKVLGKVFKLTEEDFKNLLINRSLSDF